MTNGHDHVVNQDSRLVSSTLVISEETKSEKMKHFVWGERSFGWLVFCYPYNISMGTWYLRGVWLLLKWTLWMILNSSDFITPRNQEWVGLNVFWFILRPLFFIGLHLSSHAYLVWTCSDRLLGVSRHQICHRVIKGLKYPHALQVSSTAVPQHCSANEKLTTNWC